LLVEVKSANSPICAGADESVGVREKTRYQVTLALASQQNKLREAVLRTDDYYLKIESINDTMITCVVKPFTNIHGIEFAFDKRYPTLTLTEIV